MANVNTFAAFFGGTGRNQILSQTLATATATALQVGTDSGTPATAVLVVPTQSAILGGISPLSPNVNQALLNAAVIAGSFPSYPDPPFNSGSFNGRAFKIRWAGTGSAAANAGNTLTFTLTQGTSATIGSDKAIGASAAIATASAANLNFAIEATVVWDVTSGYINSDGRIVGSYNGTTINGAFTGTTQTGLTTYATALTFVPFITWGNAVGGVITTTEFSAEQL